MKKLITLVTLLFVCFTSALSSAKESQARECAIVNLPLNFDVYELSREINYTRTGFLLNDHLIAAGYNELEGFWGYLHRYLDISGKRVATLKLNNKGSRMWSGGDYPIFDCNQEKIGTIVVSGHGGFNPISNFTILNKDGKAIATAHDALKKIFELRRADDPEQLIATITKSHSGDLLHPDKYSIELDSKNSQLIDARIIYMFLDGLMF